MRHDQKNKLTLFEQVKFGDDVRAALSFAGFFAERYGSKKIGARELVAALYIVNYEELLPLLRNWNEVRALASWQRSTLRLSDPRWLYLAEFQHQMQNLDKIRLTPYDNDVVAIFQQTAARPDDLLTLSAFLKLMRTSDNPIFAGFADLFPV